MNLGLLSGWIREFRVTDLLPGRTFNLDLSPILHRGRESVLERNYISKRSRAGKSALTFPAQDGETRAFCYPNARRLKRDRNDEVLTFVEFWRETYGRKPPHLVFDSRLTTYGALAKLDRRGVLSIRLRSRGARPMRELAYTPNNQPWADVMGQVDGHPTHHAASVVELKWLCKHFADHPALLGILLGDDKSALNTRMSVGTRFLRENHPGLMPRVCQNRLNPRSLAEHDNPIFSPQIYPTLYRRGDTAQQGARTGTWPDATRTLD